VLVQVYTYGHEKERWCLQCVYVFAYACMEKVYVYAHRHASNAYARTCIRAYACIKYVHA